ncbi:MAG: exodeoxyribonuclease VII small subunit [Acetatifactor sp.]|nr:exodeoxyribonuclease VII small subunit [Acetatifactor sp.]
MTEKKDLGHSPSIEENFAKLEETIQQLESGEVSLEEAFAFYSEGMRLIKDCNAQIDRVEKQVLKLTEEGTLEPLDALDAEL